MNKELTTLLNKGFVQLEDEWHTVELTQQLRRNQFDMSKVEIDLQLFTININ